MCGDPPPRIVSVASVLAPSEVYTLLPMYLCLTAPFLTMQISCVEHSPHTSDCSLIDSPLHLSYYSAGNSDTPVDTRVSPFVCLNVKVKGNMERQKDPEIKLKKR